MIIIEAIVFIGFILAVANLVLLTLIYWSMK